jgi:ParB family chromosome partitioning protein
MGSDILDLIAVAEYIDLSQIQPSNFPTRKETNLDELMASIRNHGLIQPIIVRIIKDGYELVAGHRRFEACRRLRWRKVPCLVLELDDKEAYEVQLVENIQRESLNPLEEAEYYKEYVSNYGWGSITQLAKKIGKSQEYISHRLQLLKLPKEVKDEIIRHRLTPSSGLEILSVGNDVDKINLARLIQEKKLSVKNIRNAVKLIKTNTDVETAVSIVSNSIPELAFKNKKQVSNQDHLSKIIKRSIMALRMAMFRIDYIIKGCNDLGLIKDEKWKRVEKTLIDQRVIIHDLIDKTITIQKELKK